ncbi:hypothetical protein M5E87_23015 [Flavonifractor plautii]|nr:hypothetical protein M5E87_23015 [Flavonifractor plautii]
MLTGYYENASPNAASPASITLLGVELEVADGAAAGLSAFAVGDRITVTLNGAGEVISACAPLGEAGGALRRASGGRGGADLRADCGG